jgi:hypothetical protein
VGATSSRTFPLFLAAALGFAACKRGAPAAQPPSRTSGEAPARPPCVYFKDLRPFLPERLTGFRLSREEGSTGKYGEVSVSEAERVFVQPGGRELSVRIVDTTLSGKLGRAIRDAASDAAGRTPSDPTAPMQLGETVGFVRYDEEERKAEANLLVGDRYVVAVTSRGFEGTAEVRRIAGALDLEGLSKLR